MRTNLSITIKNGYCFLIKDGYYEYYKCHLGDPKLLEKLVNALRYAIDDMVIMNREYLATIDYNNYYCGDTGI